MSQIESLRLIEDKLSNLSLLAYEYIKNAKCDIELAVATKVKEGIMTSSKGLTPTRCSASLKPTVPLVTAMAYLEFVYSQIFFSKFCTSAVNTKFPFFNKLLMLLRICLCSSKYLYFIS